MAHVTSRRYSSRNRAGSHWAHRFAMRARSEGVPLWLSRWHAQRADRDAGRPPGANWDRARREHRLSRTRRECAAEASVRQTLQARIADLQQGLSRDAGAPKRRWKEDRAGGLYPL